MDHCHDFSRDSCIVDGVSIAESLLYKDADEFRGQEFIDSSVHYVVDQKNNMTSVAPVNAVAAAAFGSAYSRNASGGIEELLVTSDFHRPISDAAVNNEEEINSPPTLTQFCSGNIVSSSCDSNYSKWNELVDKLVDSQEDIPSLMLDSGSERNLRPSKNHDISSAANVLLMHVNQLGDYNNVATGKSVNGRSPSSSSNGSSSMTAVGETGFSDHSIMRTHYGSSSRGSSSIITGDYNVFHSSYNNNTINNWLGATEAEGCSSRAREPEGNAACSHSNGFNCSRNDLKWANTYLVDSAMENVSSSLHRSKTEPIFSSITSGSGTKTTVSRLRPIIGKCSDESVNNLVSVPPSSSAAINNQGGTSVGAPNQSTGSHLLPMLKNSTTHSMESNLSDRKTESTSVSSLMATTVGSHVFDNGQNSNAGLINTSLSSITTPVFHITADSLRLASRSQLNPNAEKFVFVPPSSNSGNNAIIHQQQHPLIPQHIHQPQHYHINHAQPHHQQQSQQHCTSGTSLFSLQTKQNFVNCNATQCSIPGNSTVSNITSNSNCNSISANLSTIGSNVAGMTTSTISSVPSTLSHQFLTLNAISPVTYNFQSKFNTLAEQRKCLDRERNRIEAELCRQYPGKRITSSVCGASLPPAIKSCNSSDRVDRELNTVLGNHARVVALIAKMEKLQNGGEPLPSHVHSTMECWLEGIRKCQARRKEELVNMTNRQRSGPRQQDEKDVVALTLALAELTEHMRRARTALWAALQMTHKDRALSATEAFRFLDHVRRHGLMVLIPPYNSSNSNVANVQSNLPTGNISNNSAGVVDGGLITPITKASHSLLSYS